MNDIVKLSGVQRFYPETLSKQGMPTRTYCILTKHVSDKFIEILYKT
jgi:hypothetical protein